MCECEVCGPIEDDDVEVKPCPFCDDRYCETHHPRDFHDCSLVDVERGPDVSTRDPDEQARADGGLQLGWLADVRMRLAIVGRRLRARGYTLAWLVVFGLLAVGGVNIILGSYLGEPLVTLHRPFVSGLVLADSGPTMQAVHAADVVAIAAGLVLAWILLRT